MFCQSSIGDSASVPQRKSPTLFTKISSRPNRSTTVRTNCSDRAGSLILISTATQSVPAVCNCRSVCCAAALFERYAIAIRAPSCASFTAMPRPIPLLPPVTSATRFCSPILLLTDSEPQLTPTKQNALPAFRGLRVYRSHHHPSGQLYEILTNIGFSPLLSDLRASALSFSFL